MIDYKCSIIADSNGSAWDFAVGVYDYLEKKIREDYLKKRGEFATKVEGYLKGEGVEGEDLANQKRLACVTYEFMRQEDGDRLELNPIEITKFPDGEYKPKISKNVRRSNCFFIHDSNLDPDKWANMLYLVNNALRTSSPHEIINIMPYLKWSRQDRKDESRVPITAKDIADHLRYDHTRVLTIDVHNEANQGFYDIPFDSLPPYSTLFKHLEKHHPELLEDLVILAADEGCIKRVRKEAEKRGFSLAMVDKFRRCDGKLGESLGILGDVQEKTVLIPDDIISSGGTQIRAAKGARTAGALKVIGYSTHGLFTEGYEKIANELDLVLIGNTVKQSSEVFEKYPNFEEVSFEYLIGEAIYRINNGDSLSELFN